MRGTLSVMVFSAVLTASTLVTLNQGPAEAACPDGKPGCNAQPHSVQAARTVQAAVQAARTVQAARSAPAPRPAPTVPLAQTAPIRQAAPTLPAARTVQTGPAVLAARIVQTAPTKRDAPIVPPPRPAQTLPPIQTARPVEAAPTKQAAAETAATLQAALAVQAALAARAALAAQAEHVAQGQGPGEHLPPREGREHLPPSEGQEHLPPPEGQEHLPPRQDYGPLDELSRRIADVVRNIDDTDRLEHQADGDIRDADDAMDTAKGQRDAAEQKKLGAIEARQRQLARFVDLLQEALHELKPPPPPRPPEVEHREPDRRFHRPPCCAMHRYPYPLRGMGSGTP
jgi:hypothetical protein